jgi:putative acetyltransferase
VRPTIEPESAADNAAIRAVVAAAFAEHPEVADLVHAIRASPEYLPDLALVARHEGEVVGFVMISGAQLVDGDVVHDVLTLSPLAVLPALQRHGIGSALVRQALAIAEGTDAPLVLLEGSPAYYPRFGFHDSRPVGITFDLPEWAPREAGMVYELPAHQASVRGRVRYPPAFDCL